MKISGRPRIVIGGPATPLFSQMADPPVPTARLIVASCGKDEVAPGSSKVVEGKPAMAGRPIAELLGAAGNPVGALARLRMGMSAAAARKAAPEIFVKEGTDYFMAPVEGHPDLSYGVSLDKEKLTVDGLTLRMPPAARAEVEAV